MNDIFAQIATDRRLARDAGLIAPALEAVPDFTLPLDVTPGAHAFAPAPRISTHAELLAALAELRSRMASFLANLAPVFVAFIAWRFFRERIDAVFVSGLVLGLLGVTLLNVPLQYQFSLQGLVIWLMVVVALSALSCMIPARNAVRLTVRDVLAYE